jgi:hypothetical protein
MEAMTTLPWSPFLSKNDLILNGLEQLEHYLEELVETDTNRHERCMPGKCIFFTLIIQYAILMIRKSPIFPVPDRRKKFDAIFTEKVNRGCSSVREANTSYQSNR